MEGEKQIAEVVCDLAEELARRKLVQRGHGGCTATQTGEGHMEGFNDKDATNLQRVKDAMAERAVGGGVLGQPDAAAAAAFAALLDARKPGVRRWPLSLKAWTRRPRYRLLGGAGRKASSADSRVPTQP